MGSTDLGELALGQNLLVAFMPWNDTTLRTPFNLRGVVDRIVLLVFIFKN